MDRLATKLSCPNRAMILETETESCRYACLVNGPMFNETSNERGGATSFLWNSRLVCRCVVQLKRCTSSLRLTFMWPLALDLSFVLPDFLASPEDRTG